METRTFFIYRLFDAEYPTITRYVGCTKNPTAREKQHASPLTTTTALVRPWAAWMRGVERRPQLEVIDIVRGLLPEARAVELENIAKHAADNPWLLNSKEWRADKIASGIPKHVVNAYVVLACYAEFRNDYSHGHKGYAAHELERAFPRLKIFHYRYIAVTEYVEQPARSEAVA
jgi:hypothetical protein